jgi:hypothetical protein
MTHTLQLAGANRTFAASALLGSIGDRFEALIRASHSIVETALVELQMKVRKSLANVTTESRKRSKCDAAASAPHGHGHSCTYAIQMSCTCDMHVHMQYACHTHTHTHAHARAHACMHAHAHMHVHVHAHVHAKRLVKRDAPKPPAPKLLRQVRHIKPPAPSWPGKRAIAGPAASRPLAA